MGKYLISKFDPKQLNENSIYEPREWDSIYDIGKSNSGDILTKDRYLFVEQKYVDVVKALVVCLGIKKFRVVMLEKDLNEDEFLKNIEEFRDMYSSKDIDLYKQLIDGQYIKYDDLDSLIKLVLRENLWCILVGETDEFFSLYFGYNFEVTISCHEDNKIENLLNKKSDLFVSKIVQERPRVLLPIV